MYCSNMLFHTSEACLRFTDREGTFEFRPYLPELYRCVFLRLKAADIDQEVKERAISCM